MKRVAILVLIVTLTKICAFAQHEGIERHFNTFKFDVFQNHYSDSYLNDTLLENFHNVESYYKLSSFGGFQAGNYAQAFKPFCYFDTKETDFLFLNPYQTYTTQLNEIVYFDARKPFSLFKFTSGPQKYEDVTGVLSVNLTPFVNVGMKYHSVKTDGSFIHSASNIKDFVLWQSYTKKRYENHLSFIYNGSKSQEFGGLINDTVYESGEQRIGNVDVNLRDADALLRSQSLFFAHEYKLGEMSFDTIKSEKDTLIDIRHLGNFSLYQEFSLNRNWRIYNDVPSDFYENIYRDSLLTKDSISLNYLTHSAGVIWHQQLDSLSRLKIYVGMYNRVTKAHIPDNDEVFQEYGLKSNLKGNKSDKFYYSAKAYVGLAGRTVGDYAVNSYLLYAPDSMKNHSFHLNISVLRKTPDYFYENYSSNNFVWKSEFQKEFKTKSEITYFNRKLNANIYLKHSLINNMIYIPESGIPSQYDSLISILNAGFGKTFRLGPFGLSSEISYQYLSDKTTIHLPELMGYAGVFYQKWIFDKHMNLRIGADLRMISQTESYTYIPATGFFALQSVKKTGNSPLIDAYVSFKVKRLRAFVRYSNIGQSFLNIYGYSLLHYPERAGGLHFGFSWEFYD